MQWLFLIDILKKTHEGVRYPCDHCSYVATRGSNLKIHIKNIHEGVGYPCAQCDYLATQSCHLKTHQKKKHFN